MLLCRGRFIFSPIHIRKNEVKCYIFAELVLKYAIYGERSEDMAGVGHSSKMVILSMDGFEN